MDLDPHRMPYHPPRERADALRSGIRPTVVLSFVIAIGVLVLVLS